MFVKVLLSILTLLTVLFCLGLGIWGAIKLIPILAVTCFALAAGFGMFSYYDLRYWIAYFQGKLNVPPTK